MREVMQGIQNVMTGHPAPLLRPVALPVHQILPTASPTAHIQKPPDDTGRMVVDEPRGLEQTDLIKNTWKVG